MGMGKSLTLDPGRSWPSCPWESQKNIRRACDREGDPVALVILEIYQENLHILLVPIHGASPKLGLLSSGWGGHLWLGGRSGPLSVHTTWALGKVQFLETLLLCVSVLSFLPMTTLCFLGQAGQIWSGGTFHPGEKIRWTFLLQPLFLSLNELLMLFDFYQSIMWFHSLEAKSWKTGNMAWLCCLLAVWPGVSWLTSIWFHFLICEMGLTAVPQ